MLSQQYRLKGQKNFSRVLSSLNIAHGQFLSVKFIENNMGTSRFGLIVSRKISPLAVKRNYIKRVISNIIMSNRQHINKGFDVVILPKKNIVNIHFSNLKNDLENTLQKAKVLY